MSDDFHTTLERLREARDEIERDFDRRLAALDEKVGEARSALEAAAELAAVGPEPIDETPGSQRGLHPEPWPSRGGLRGLVDRLGHWLLRGHLDTLDRRHHRLSEALADATAARVRDHGAVDRAHVEAIRELAGRATEAAEIAAVNLRRMKELLNAKEAETVHVATHGARAQAELTLMELARQQEALLSELVGRRQQLDRLLQPGDDAEPTTD